MASNPTQVWTIGSLLTWTTTFFTNKGIDEPRLSAELLLAHSLKCSRMQRLYTQYEKVPPEGQLAAFRALLKERANHVPVAYLIGKAWFFSLELTVNRDVLIPRSDTETLVEFVIQHARQRTEWAGTATPNDPGFLHGKRGRFRIAAGEAAADVDADGDADLSGEARWRWRRRTCGGLLRGGGADCVSAGGFV